MRAELPPPAPWPGNDAKFGEPGNQYDISKSATVPADEVRRCLCQDIRRSVGEERLKNERRAGGDIAQSRKITCNVVINDGTHVKHCGIPIVGAGSASPEEIKNRCTV
jgi:hypothetical protein